MHGSQKFSQNFHRKPLSNLVKVLNVYLEMSSDSKNYFGCVVGGIFLRAHSIKSLWSRHISKQLTSRVFDVKQFFLRSDLGICQGECWRYSGGHFVLKHFWLPGILIVRAQQSDLSRHFRILRQLQSQHNSYRIPSSSLKYFQGHPTKKNKRKKKQEKRFECSFLLPHIVLWSFKGTFVRPNTIWSVRMW